MEHRSALGRHRTALLLASLLPLAAVACSAADSGHGDDAIDSASSVESAYFLDLFNDDYLQMGYVQELLLQTTPFKSRDISDGAIIGMNGLDVRDLVFNLITGDADNTRAIVANPLSGSTFSRSFPLSRAVEDPATRNFLKYVSLCALGPDQSLVYFQSTAPKVETPRISPTFGGLFGTTNVATAPVTSTNVGATQATNTGGLLGGIGVGVVVPEVPLMDFPGMFGLCREWATTGNVSSSCQEAVSACVMLHSNARDQNHRISLRGEPRGLPIPLAPKVRVNRFDPVKTRANRPSLNASMRRCTENVSGPANCGYGEETHVGYVGVCKPGERIQIGAGSSPTCSGTLGRGVGDNVMQVCYDSQSPCTYTAPVDCSNAPSTSLCVPDMFQYFGKYNDDSCGTVAPALEFECPRQGFFSVMLAPYSRANRSANAEAGVALAAPGVKPSVIYPAPEWAVFNVREDAAMGNLFETSGRVMTVTRSSTGSLVPRYFTQAAGLAGTLRGVQVEYTPRAGEDVFVNGAAYVCNDEEFGYDGFWRERFCVKNANGANICFARYLGVCNPANAPRVCTSDDGARVKGDRDFAGCSAGGRAWPNALTSMIDPVQKCARNPQLRGCKIF